MYIEGFMDEGCCGYGIRFKSQFSLNLYTFFFSSFDVGLNVIEKNWVFYLLTLSTLVLLHPAGFWCAQNNLVNQDEWEVNLIWNE